MSEPTTEGSQPDPNVPNLPPAADEAELMFGSEDSLQDNAARDRSEPVKDIAEQQGFTSSGAKGGPAQNGVAIRTRPSLKRETSVPAPQQPPPPAPPAPQQDPGNPTDSLSLMQLKKLVTDMPKAEPTPYTFQYQDASSFPDEIEEWFSYSVEERAMLLKAQSSFMEKWTAFIGSGITEDSAYDNGEYNWIHADTLTQEYFISSLFRSEPDQGETVSDKSDQGERLRCLEAAVYLVLGCWYETAGIDSREGREPTYSFEEEPRCSEVYGSNYAKLSLQVEWMHKNAEILCKRKLVQEIYDNLRTACLLECEISASGRESSPEEQETRRREIWCTLTLLYVILDVARSTEWNAVGALLRINTLNLKPNLLIFLSELIDKLRWDDSIDLPLPKVLLLFWKAILVSFGGIAEADKAKAFFKDPSLEESDKRGQPLITASPLDYHFFRQEISSKYPAYNPPPPLFPLEPENNSILPPLKPDESKASAGGTSGTSSVNGNGTSIFHQPVHIATPAPSPPPSPAGAGGKGGKKQNYQTNQLFPFLYPPLNEESNKLGGKGTTDLQDALVGRKWEGADIPISILEGAELFAKRMRATRALKQLWEERVEFMKFERGYTDTIEKDDVEPLELDPQPESTAGKEDDNNGHDASYAGSSDSVEARLQLVENYYRDTLPHLQSIVMVLLKVILSNVTALITQINGQNGLQSGYQTQENQNGSLYKQPEVNGANNPLQPDLVHSSSEELDAVRLQEIMAKAVSGILILLLKWFKVSHVLKFEYLAQLIVDANYIPLILKLMQTQEIERIVNYKCDREDLNFFHFSRAHSRIGPDLHSPTSSEDDAVPPPIKRHRDDASAPSTTDASTTSPQPLPPPPEVDELGFPTTALPSTPITTFSWRNFFSSITFLRILQKLCKNKAHRNLLLVSYKSSQMLKKSLKVPQPQLRLYTLKLFKNQVPYCGRKWRQSNMRVITAVYLHCRPELRDEWLSGADVDGAVEESLPLEQALRALTHWYHLRRYPEGVGANRGKVLEEEMDWFRRELEKVGWGEEAGVEEGEWEGAQGEGW